MSKPFITPLLSLFRSRKFLVALFAVIQTVLFVLRPDINQDVWKAIDALAAVLIAAIAHEDAAAKSATRSGGLAGEVRQ